MHDIINAALRYLGRPRCNADPEQMREVNDLLQRAKPYWRSINVDGSRELLVSSDVVVDQIWAGRQLDCRHLDTRKQRVQKAKARDQSFHLV
jgi:spermidine/putrescine transport system substrate-binding protein